MKKKNIYLSIIIIILAFIVINFLGLVIGKPKVAKSERYLYKRLVHVNDSGGISTPVYCWREDFDKEVAAVGFESGLVADEWTTAGTNYSSSQVVYAGGAGGTITLTPDGTNDSSNNIIRTSTTWSIAKNPVLEGRFKVDDVSNCWAGIGLVDAAFVVQSSVSDDIVMIVLDNDSDSTEDHSLELWTAKNGTETVVDLGVDVTNDTFIKFKIDCADPNQPRVWIDDVEIASSLITGTLLSTATLYPFALIVDLATDAPVLTIDYIDGMQER